MTVSLSVLAAFSSADAVTDSPVIRSHSEDGCAKLAERSWLRGERCDESMRADGHACVQTDRCACRRTDRLADMRADGQTCGTSTDRQTCAGGHCIHARLLLPLTTLNAAADRRGEGRGTEEDRGGRGGGGFMREGCIWMHLDAFGCIWMHLDAFDSAWQGCGSRVLTRHVIRDVPQVPTM